MHCDNPYSFRFHIMIQFIMYLSRDLYSFRITDNPQWQMKLKRSTKGFRRKSDQKKMIHLKWMNLSGYRYIEINCPLFCPTTPPEITQLNKELAVNRDTGKKHSGEAPSEKLVRKFKENPFLPIGGRLAPKKRI